MSQTQIKVWKKENFPIFQLVKGDNDGTLSDSLPKYDGFEVWFLARCMSFINFNEKNVSNSAEKNTSRP